MEEQPIIQIAYASCTRGLLSYEGILDILKVSREKNMTRGITGMLLYKNGNVLQVIEGTGTDVGNLFDVILRDNRHYGVLKLYEREIERREFSEWLMGFSDFSEDGSRNLEGFSEFLEEDFDFRALEPSSALELLSTFRSGIR
jgi:hypothetical protein